MSSQCFTLKQPQQSNKRFGRSSFLRITVTVIFLRFSLSFCVNKRPQSCHHRRHPQPSALSPQPTATPRTPSTWPRRGNWQLGLGPALGALLSLPLSLALLVSFRAIHSFNLRDTPSPDQGHPRTHVCHIYDTHTFIYIFYAGNLYSTSRRAHSLHFPRCPLCSLFKVDSRFSSAPSTGNWQLAVATVPLLHVQRATIAATCVLICSERFALMPKNARVGQGVLEQESEQQETWLPRGHMMQH